MDNPDLKHLLDGLNKMSVCAGRLCNFRGNPGQHEQIRSELLHKGYPALQQFNEKIMRLAHKYFPESFQQPPR